MSVHPSLARNVTSNWASMALGIAYALVITPIVVRALDTQLYGAWSFINGLLAYSELFYLGLGSAIIRYVAEASVTRDIARISRLASVVFTIYGLIGLVTCLLVAVGAFWIPDLLAEPLAPGVERPLIYTCMLLGVRLLLAFVSSAFAGVLAGHSRFDLVNGVGLAGTVLRFALIPLLLGRGSDALLMLALLLCGSAILETLALAAIAHGHVKGLRIRPTMPALHELRTLYSFGLVSFFVLFSFKIISYTDTTVVGIQIGLTAVALYALPLQLVEYARALVGGFSGVLLPRLSQMVARGDVAQLRDEYLRSARVGCFIAGWVGGLVISLGPLFLTRWVGPEFGTASTGILVWLSAAAFSQAISTQVPFPFYAAMQSLAVPAVILTVEALANLLLSVWLAPRMGIEGVALATALPAVFFTLLLLPPYLCRRLGLPVRTLVLRGIAPGGIMLAVTFVVQVGLSQVMASESYVLIATRAALTLPVATAVFLLTFPAQDQRLVMQVVRLRSRLGF